jgi:nucleoside-diphosphate-sugar epimerase
MKSIYDKVLITGANGFLGHSFIKYYSTTRMQTIGLVRTKFCTSKCKVIKTSYNVNELKSIIEIEKPELIIHYAGSSSVSQSIKTPWLDFQSSVLLWHKLLEAVRLSSIKPRVIFISSAAVYGNPKNVPIKEDSPLDPISIYGNNKLYSEYLAKFYSIYYNIQFIIIRVFSIFGPLQRKLLLFELFEQFTNDNEKVIIQGSGHEIRDYIWIDDFMQLLIEIALNNKEKYVTVNLASGEKHKIIDIAYYFKNILHSDKEIICLKKPQTGNPTTWQADISRLEKIVGYKIKFNFEEKLYQYITELKKENNI